jgi:hypothetical protein
MDTSTATDPTDPGEIKVLMDGDEGSEKAPIRFCQEHWDRLVAAINDEAKVMAAFDTLTRLSLRTLGSVDVCKFGCPVCALNKFDFIAAMAEVLTTEPVERRIVTL